MLSSILFVTLLILGIRTYLGLRREATVLSEFKQTNLLGYLALFSPLIAVVMFVGGYFMPQPVLFVVALAFFAWLLYVATKQAAVLERAGTDRASGAIAATSFAVTTAIVGIVYIGLTGTFSALVYVLNARH